MPLSGGRHVPACIWAAPTARTLTPRNTHLPARLLRLHTALGKDEPDCAGTAPLYAAFVLIFNGVTTIVATCVQLRPLGKRWIRTMCVGRAPSHWDCVAGGPHSAPVSTRPARCAISRASISAGPGRSIWQTAHRCYLLYGVYLLPCLDMDYNILCRLAASRTSAPACSFMPFVCYSQHCGVYAKTRTRTRARCKHHGCGHHS